MLLACDVSGGFCHGDRAAAFLGLAGSHPVLDVDRLGRNLEHRIIVGAPRAFGRSGAPYVYEQP
jgi:hypothetical protein